MAKGEYRVVTTGNTSLAERVSDSAGTEVEDFHDWNDAVLYAALSKQKWETVEVHRMIEGIGKLVLRFHRGVKDYDERSDPSVAG